jgi:hypothetical protein
MFRRIIQFLSGTPPPPTPELTPIDSPFLDKQKTHDEQKTYEEYKRMKEIIDKF